MIKQQARPVSEILNIRALAALFKVIEIKLVADNQIALWFERRFNPDFDFELHQKGFMKIRKILYGDHLWVVGSLLCASMTTHKANVGPGIATLMFEVWLDPVVEREYRINGGMFYKEEGKIVLEEESGAQYYFRV